MAEGFWRVQVLGSTPSTQDMVRNLAETGEPEGLAIQALQQTKGRGRHGNDWVSPMGNLYLSVLLRPVYKADRAGQMAFVCALALSEAIDVIVSPSPLGEGRGEGPCPTGESLAPHLNPLPRERTFLRKTLKWPNDVLVDGRKISGILLESKLDAQGRVESLIIGTGVNIFAPPKGAIGLDEIKGRPVYVNTFRDLYLEKLLFQYRLWQEKGFAPIREAWLKQAHGLNENMKIRLPEVTYEGIFRGIDENGVLLAEIDGQIRTFSAGEVHFGVT